MAPVHEAARRNDVEALRRLLDEDPRLLESEEGYHPSERPLHVACRVGAMEAACFLLDRGADLHRRDPYGVTAFMRACEAGRVEVASMLLGRGADPTLRNGMSWTALMYACSGVEGRGTDHVAVIRLLLEDGRVPVDARSDHGSTALGMACSKGHVERARVLLLEGGADSSLANQCGMVTASRHHRDRRHAGWTRLLKWFEGELEKPFLLSKARAVVDAAESINKAPEKVGAKTEADAQQAMEKVSPVYLRGRVERAEALPSVKVVGQAGGQEADEEDEELEAVCEYVVRHLKQDLYVELMEGLRLR